MNIPTKRNPRLAFCLSTLLLISPLVQTVSTAQETAQQQVGTATAPDVSQFMRLEKIDVTDTVGGTGS